VRKGCKLPPPNAGDLEGSEQENESEKRNGKHFSFRYQRGWGAARLLGATLFPSKSQKATALLVYL